MSDRHPIVWRRAIIAGIGIYAAVLVVAVALQVFVLDPLGVPELAQVLCGALIAGIGLWVVFPRYLRPWYRPAPKREQWTEDRL